MAKHKRQLRMLFTLHPTYSSLEWHSPHSFIVERFFIVRASWIGIGPSCLVGLYSQLRGGMWRCVSYVCFCHVLVVFVSGGWYLSYTDTRSLFTRELSWYAASVVTPYLWDFIHLDLFGWILEVGEMILSEERFFWLGILAKSSLVNECVKRTCVGWRLHVFAINLEFFSPYLHSWILLWWNDR